LLASCILFGLFFFPAVLMTTLNGDSYLNLRFDRVVSVIRICGAGYWLSFLAFTIGGGIYLMAIGLVNASIMWLFIHGSVHAPIVGLSVGTPALLLGIYLMHFACWHLGLLCRTNRDQFPWALQRHVSSRRTDTLAQLEAARRAAIQHDALKKNRPDREKRVAEIRNAEKGKRPTDDAKPIWDRVAETHKE
jgi:hypothetical protein